MSAQAFSYVIKHSRHKGGELLCLMIIANHADPAGRDSFPSMQTLADECRMSERQVRRIIERLEASGELLVERRRGRGNSHTFTVVMQDLPENRTKCPINEGSDNVGGTPKTGQNVTKPDKMTDIHRRKPDISDTKTGHFEQENRTFPALKPDISDTPNDNHPEQLFNQEGTVWDAHGRESAPTAHNANAKKTQTEAEWLQELRCADAYTGIDVDRELSKCHVWCRNNNREFTRRRFVNWLNRADKPISAESPPMPPGRTRLSPYEERIASENARIDATVNALKAQLGNP